MFKNSNKVLTTIFFILMIVFIGEVLYLFLFNKTKVSPIDNVANSFESQSISDGELEIDPSNITYLQSLPADPGWAHYLSQTVTGIIANYKIEGDNFSFDLYDEQTKSFLQGFSGSVTNPTFTRKVYIGEGDNLTVTDESILGRLKNDDKIKITRYYDLSLPFNKNLLYNENVIYR